MPIWSLTPSYPYLLQVSPTLTAQSVPAFAIAPLVPLSVRLTTVLLFILFFVSDQHALRVLTILGISDCISELVYCDYARPDGEFGCKPEVGFFNEVRVHSIHPCLPLCTVYLLPHC